MKRILFEIGQLSHGAYTAEIIKRLSLDGFKVILSASTISVPGLQRVNLHERKFTETINDYIMVRDDIPPDEILQPYILDYLHYGSECHKDTGVAKIRAKNTLMLICERLNTSFPEVVMEHRSNATYAAQVSARIKGLNPHKKIIDFLKKKNLDALVVTPLVFTHYSQHEIVRAAQFLNIPVLYLMYSWDNLTTKGVFSIEPDAYLVWNEMLRNEAIAQHNVAPEKIFVVGTSRFNNVMAIRGKWDSETFRRENGLMQEDLIVTYLGSTNIVGSNELDYFDKWCDSLNQLRARLEKKLIIIVKPHPKFASQWIEHCAGRKNIIVIAPNLPVVKLVDKVKLKMACLFDSWINSLIMPTIRAGSLRLILRLVRFANINAVTLKHNPQLYDVLSVSKAVVAVNTSAQIEAAIFNVPSLRVYDETMRMAEIGTPHYSYLDNLTIASHSMESHSEQLKLCIEGNLETSQIQTELLKFLGLDLASMPEFNVSKLIKSYLK